MWLRLINNLPEEFNCVNKSHDKSSSSNRFHKNGNQRTDLHEIFDDKNNNNNNSNDDNRNNNNSNNNDNNKNNNNNNNNSNDNNKNNNNNNRISGNNNNDNFNDNDNNKKNEYDNSNNYEDNFDRSHSNGIERKLHEKDILDFEELRKWRELEREADESFIKSLKQTKLDLIEKLQLLGDLESWW